MAQRMIGMRKRIKRRMIVWPVNRTPPTLADLIQLEDIGSMNFDIPFVDSQVGMIAYIAVCFSNDTGDGTYSEIIAKLFRSGIDTQSRAKRHSCRSAKQIYCAI